MSCTDFHSPLRAGLASAAQERQGCRVPGSQGCGKLGRCPHRGGGVRREGSDLCLMLGLRCLLLLH